MRLRRKMPLYTSVFSVFVLGVAFFADSLLTGEVLSESQDGVTVKRESTHRQPSQKANRVNLGDGVGIEETVRKSRNGQVRTCMSTVFCDDQRLMTIVSSSTAGQKSRRTTTKTYWQNGSPIVSEVDEDGDGVFDLLIVSDDNGPKQAFDQKKDGRLLVVSRNRLKEMKDAYGLGLKMMKPIVEGARSGATEQEIQRLVENAIEKMTERSRQQEKERKENGKRENGTHKGDA